MKREGRQHGMVRTYRILPAPWCPKAEPRFVQRFDSPTTAGLFAKVPAKPTNHSKFTGRCGTPRCVGCHMHPACKSKEKTKGSHKLKSSDDMVTNYRLITWRVADGRPGSNFSGFSASRILDHLSNEYEDYEGNDDYVDDNDHDYDYENDDDDRSGLVQDGFKELEIEGGIEGNIVDDDGKSEGVYIDDDDDDVKFVQDQDLEDEGWCLVGEI